MQKRNGLMATDNRQMTMDRSQKLLPLAYDLLPMAYYFLLPKFLLHPQKNRLTTHQHCGLVLGIVKGSKYSDFACSQDYLALMNFRRKRAAGRGAIRLLRPDSVDNVI